VTWLKANKDKGLRFPLSYGDLQSTRKSNGVKPAPNEISTTAGRNCTQRYTASFGMDQQEPGISSSARLLTNMTLAKEFGKVIPFYSTRLEPAIEEVSDP
jgi:hypothetical protein